MEQDGGSSVGSSMTSESVSQSMRSGATSLTGASASTASRLTISSFCSSQMELDESRPIPREVRPAAGRQSPIRGSLLTVLFRFKKSPSTLELQQKASAPLSPLRLTATDAPRPGAHSHVICRKCMTWRSIWASTSLLRAICCRWPRCRCRHVRVTAVMFQHALHQLRPYFAAGSAAQKLGNI
jgi:hypothetical protein